MAKLIGTDVLADRREYHWLHTGNDGRDAITIQTVQETDPIIASVDLQRQLPVDRKSSFRLKAKIPATLIEDAARIKAREWGIKKADAFREIATAKTDRGKAVWTALTTGRDYRKFQI